MTSPNRGPTPVPLKWWEEHDPEGRQHVQGQRWLVSEARMKTPVSQLLVQGLSYCTTPKIFFFRLLIRNQIKQGETEICLLLSPSKVTFLFWSLPAPTLFQLQGCRIHVWLFLQVCDYPARKWVYTAALRSCLLCHPFQHLLLQKG